MNGNNSQTREGFIKALSHPRKKELAELMLNAESPEAAVKAAQDSGADRITIMEMGREIRQSVEGMQDFRIKVIREESEVPTEGDGIKLVADNAPVADAPVAADPAATDQSIVPPAADENPEAPVVDESQNIPGFEAVDDEPVVTDGDESNTPEAPTAPEVNTAG